jgi:hypothetical protein
MAGMYAVMMRAQRRTVQICSSMDEVMQLLGAKAVQATPN